MLPRTRPATGDAFRLAAELVDGGFSVALEGAPERDVAAVCARLARAGLAGSCEVIVPVRRPDDVVAVADLGSAVALAGPRNAVTAVSARLPGARAVVPAAEPGAEEWCRDLVHGRVRLVSGRGVGADLAFVRCLNVLMAGDGQPAVATADPTLVAIAGERAAWNDRTPDSWEHVMPYGVRTDEQQRLVAAGQRLRVGLPSGPGAGRAAVLALARRMAGRA